MPSAMPDASVPLLPCRSRKTSRTEGDDEALGADSPRPAKRIRCKEEPDDDDAPDFSWVPAVDEAETGHGPPSPEIKMEYDELVDLEALEPAEPERVWDDWHGWMSPEAYTHLLEPRPEILGLVEAPTPGRRPAIPSAAIPKAAECGPGRRFDGLRPAK